MLLSRTCGISADAESSHDQIHAVPCTSVKECCHWDADATWKRLRHDLERFPAGLQVLELCGGVGTGHIALHKLLKDVAAFNVVGHYDIDEALQPLLTASGLPLQNIHLGRKKGDILKQSPQDFPLHHLLVAGPPCPPWSSIGSRSSWEDTRSQAFDKVMEIIAYHAEHGNLLLFVLENVVGMSWSTKGSTEKPIDIVVKRLRKTCPGWAIEVHRVNSLDFGLPQSRTRLYVVGRRYSPEKNESYMPPLRKFQQRLPLSKCLDTSDKIPGTYTSLQRKNIREWKALYKFELNTEKFLNQFAVVDASRTPSTRTVYTKATKHPDRCPCLTASGPKLHVFALGPHTDETSSPLDRPMRNTERAKVQGFYGAIVDAASHMSVADGKRIFGNAMTVPAVGCVIARELLGLLRALNIEKLTAILSSTETQSQRYSRTSSRTTHSESSTRKRTVSFSSSSTPPTLPNEDGDPDHKRGGIAGISTKRKCL